MVFLHKSGASFTVGLGTNIILFATYMLHTKAMKGQTT